MSIVDYHIEELVNRLRVHTNDDDAEILALWEELINVDIVSVLAQNRHKELPRLEMYAYGAHTIEKVKYGHRYSHLWQDANGACYDCQKQYLEQHTYACIECGSPYFQSHPIQVRCENCQKERNTVLPQNKRAQKLGLRASLSYKQWTETLVYFEQKCAYCGGDYEVIEHFTPLARGGETSARNCIPACRSCNSSKSNIDGRTEAAKLAVRLCIPIARLYDIQGFLEAR